LSSLGFPSPRSFCPLPYLYDMGSPSCAAALTAAAVACVLGAAAADSYSYGDYKEYNVREVSKKDLKCAGSPGKPYVHYVPCEDGYHCVEKDSYGSDEWGRYCLPIPKGYYEGKCYKTGEKCMGAAGKPFVQYLPCCTAGNVCKELAYGIAKDSEWGSFCVPAAGEDKPPVYGQKDQPKSEYDSKFYDYKCHATGSKCSGAPGYPYVDYGNGCCSATDSCVPDSSKGWGNFCKPMSEVYSEYEQYKEDPKSYKPPAPVYENWFTAPKGESQAEPQNPYAPKKCQGYGCETSTPTPCVGYGCKDDKAVTPVPLDSKLSTLLGLPGSTACAPTGTTPAVPNTPTPPNGVDIVRVDVPLPDCSAPAVFSQADADAILNAICTRARSADPTAVCYIEEVDTPVVRSAVLEGGNDLASVERQRFRRRVRIIIYCFNGRAVMNILRILGFILALILGIAPSPGF
jgi:hypothetical protein